MPTNLLEAKEEKKILIAKKRSLKGWNMTEEQKEKLRQKAIGRKHSIETKKLMSLSRVGKSNNFYGKKHTSETLKKITGKNHHHWKGGRTIRDGYVLIRKPDHPRARNGYVLEHVLVMEAHLKRYLTEEEYVHHINHKRDDNRLENLILLTPTDHANIHKGEDGRFVSHELIS